MSDPSLLVLLSLADEPKHGYAMMEDIEDFAGQRLGPGTLYGAITRLEDKGLIRAMDTDDRRKPYELTTSGHKELQAQLAQLNRVVKAGQGRLKHA
jgi:DNA-binding PadR family transcriptional regulator